MRRVSNYAVSALTVTDIWRPCSAASEERAAWAAAVEGMRRDMRGAEQRRRADSERLEVDEREARRALEDRLDELAKRMGTMVRGLSSTC
jgi:hypothetical protein